MMQILILSGMGYLLGRTIANRTAMSSLTLFLSLIVTVVAAIIHCVPPSIILLPLAAIGAGFWRALRA